MEGSKDGVTPCVWSINKSKGFGAKKINFVVTLNAQGNAGRLDRCAVRRVLTGSWPWLAGGRGWGLLARAAMS